MNADFLTKKVGPLPAWGWGVLGLAGVVLYLRHRATSSGTTSSAGTTTSASVPFGAASTGAGTSASNGYAPSLGDQLGTLTQNLSSLQGLQAQLASMGLGSQQTATASGPTQPNVGAFVGSGYGPPAGQTIVTTPGGNYQYLGNWSQVQDLINAGQSLYTQPQQGVFVPWTGVSSAQPGTPLFASTPYFPAPPPVVSTGSAAPIQPNVGVGG